MRLTLVQIVNSLYGIFYDVFEERETRLDLLGADIKYRLLCLIEKGVDILRCIVTFLHDLGRSIDEGAQDHLLFNDLGIM